MFILPNPKNYVDVEGYINKCKLKSGSGYCLAYGLNVYSIVDFIAKKKCQMDRFQSNKYRYPCLFDSDTYCQYKVHKYQE